MTLEQVFECPHTLSKLRSGPLGGLMNGFCDDLLASGFSRSTVRKHLSNVSHLNVYLMTRKGVAGHSLSSQDVSEFLRDYPLRARNRGPLDRHIAGVKTAINRLVKYLCASGHHFETLVEAAIYQPLLEAYLNWLEEHQHAAPGTIRLRAHNLDQFLQWLGPMATPQGCAELTPDTVERFFLTYARHTGRAVRRSMQAALRTFFRFCLQHGYIQQPLDRVVPTLRVYKLASVPRGLSNEQALKLLQCIDRRSHAGRRDYAICLLICIQILPSSCTEYCTIENQSTH